MLTKRGSRPKARLKSPAGDSTTFTAQNDDFVTTNRSSRATARLNSQAGDSTTYTAQYDHVVAIKCKFCSKLFVHNGKALLNHKIKHAQPSSISGLVKVKNKHVNNADKLFFSGFNVSSCNLNLAKELNSEAEPFFFLNPAFSGIGHKSN